MSLNTNDIRAMVYLQPRSVEALSPDPLPQAPGIGGMRAEPDNALHALLQAVDRHGAQAGEVAEQELEALQERFLALLHAQLDRAHIEPSDKLSLSLSADNTLLIQSSDDNEALLAALANDAALQDMFVELQTLAIISEGIRYLNGAHGQSPAAQDGLMRYKMCLKGALSHFYLRNR